MLQANQSIHYEYNPLPGYQFSRENIPRTSNQALHELAHNAAAAVAGRTGVIAYIGLIIGFNWQQGF